MNSIGEFSSSDLISTHVVCTLQPHLQTPHNGQHFYLQPKIPTQLVLRLYILRAAGQDNKRRGYKFLLNTTEKLIQCQLLLICKALGFSYYKWVSCTPQNPFWGTYHLRCLQGSVNTALLNSRKILCFWLEPNILHIIICYRIVVAIVSLEMINTSSTTIRVPPLWRQIQLNQV